VQRAHRARILQGQKGNDARFINHSCSPNIEVRKYQTAGAGLEEYEIGFWALRDIAAGEEVSARRSHIACGSSLICNLCSCVTITTLTLLPRTSDPSITRNRCSRLSPPRDVSDVSAERPTVQVGWENGAVQRASPAIRLRDPTSQRSPSCLSRKSAGGQRECRTRSKSSRSSRKASPRLSDRVDAAGRAVL